MPRKLSQTEYECELMELGKGVLRARLFNRMHRERHRWIVDRVLRNYDRYVTLSDVIEEMEKKLPFPKEITDADLREEMEKRAR